MAVNVYDRWHKTQPRDDEPKCREHKGLVPSKAHGKGDRWQVRWDVYQDGERHQPKRNFRLKVGNDPEIHADAFVLKLQAELSNPPVKTEEKSPITVSEISKEWLSSLLIADSTRTTLTSRLRKHVWRSALGDLAVYDLYEDPQLIQLWIKEMREGGLASSTARQIATNLSSVLNFAHFKEIIPGNPIPKSPVVKFPPPSKKTVVPYTPEQLDAIRANLREKYRVVVEAGYRAGLRIGEIYGLSPDDIQGNDLFVRRQVRTNDRSGKSQVFALPKRGKTRTVPLPDSLRNYLESLPTSLVTLPWDKVTGKPITVRVFMARNGRLFNGSALSRAWDKAHELAGIVRIPWEDKYHRLRHTYASRLLRAGVDIRSLAVYLGHDDPGFTLKRYCHFMIGDGSDVRRAIDGDVPDV